MNDRGNALARVENDIHRKEITLDTSNYVAMANRMILYTASNLTLNEVKLLRFIIMQTKKDDHELYEFQVAVKDLAKIFGVKAKDFYKKIRIMTRHIMQEVIEIEDPEAEKLVQFHWVDECEYKKGIITIKIADRLKPFLTELRGSFTRYELEEIIRLNSNYAIRIYETIRSYMDDNNLPYADRQTTISIPMDVLRRVTNTEKKFERYSNFKAKVIDVAVREINRCSKYHIIATPYKSGRAIVGFEFLIESQVGYYVRMKNQDPKIEDPEEIDGQMSLMDFDLSKKLNEQ